MKNLKKITMAVLAGAMALTATCVSAFAETIYGYTYIPETGEVVESQMDSSEMPDNVKTARYLPETPFDVQAPLYTQAVKVPINIKFSAGEEYIWVTFDDKNPSCRLKLRNVATGAYAVDWTPLIQQNTTYFRNFPAATYNIYMARVGSAKRMTGTIYTQ